MPLLLQLQDFNQYVDSPNLIFDAVDAKLDSLISNILTSVSEASQDGDENIDTMRQKWVREGENVSKKKTPDPDKQIADMRKLMESVIQACSPSRGVTSSTLPIYDEANSVG